MMMLYGVVFRAKQNNWDESFETPSIVLFINHLCKSSIADAQLCTENASDYIYYKLGKNFLNLSYLKLYKFFVLKNILKTIH